MATFTGTAGPDTADAGTGTLTGFTGGSVAELTDAQGDVFFGQDGDDSITAGPGDDRLRGGLGADVLRGGGGSDTVDYLDNFGAVFVNLDIGQGFGNAAQGDTYDSIENVVGTIYNDFIIGNAGANVLDGSQGNDYMIGSLGADTLIGGSGFDIASYEENAGAIFINLLTGMGYGNAAQGDTYSSIEGIVGTLYDDYIIAASTVSPDFHQPGTRGYVDGGSGNDFIISGAGEDTLIGGAGEDTVSFQNNLVDPSFGQVSGMLIDLAAGTAIDRALNRNTTDLIQGFENVIGSSRSDDIIGNDNDNVLFGKSGRDYLFGGEGRDIFVFDTPIPEGRPELGIGSTNVDTIFDMTAFDYIYLDRSTVYSELPFGPLSPAAFVVGTEATTADHRIVYDQASGALFYDPDGVGGTAQMQFAILSGSPDLVPEQIFVSG